jgi:hypothetical protein
MVLAVAGVLVLLGTYIVVVKLGGLQRKPECGKLMSALQAFAIDMMAKGHKLPPAICVRDLVAGGYLEAANLQAFDGVEFTVNANADETRPQTILIRARLPDGRVIVVLGDGSAQQVTPAFERLLRTNDAQNEGQPSGPPNGSQSIPSETNRTPSAAGSRR